ncbi:peptidase U32 family protein [Thiovibrio sp. JS02]
MQTLPSQIMELLAPAGTIEAFEAAVAAGADAVYIGAPAFNARALAKHFSLAEVAAMLDHAHKNRVRVYLAMNSLMKEDEIPKAVEILAALEALDADALIVQDLGIYHLARRFFPRLRLHASTLMGAHNSMNVRQFSEMGFRRVVLAREMTIEEISRIHRQCPVEIEVFVHGALCFAYSGLCLFSSYLGGKSGLRGRCVQPCRRRYTWAGKGKGPGASAGYLFSMNDLSGLPLLSRLRQAGVTSLKIEGRMRSAQYVASVVKAYRLALDAPEDSAALAEAGDLLEQAMGRKASCGYFLKAQPEDLIVPQHSGNIGLFLGKIDKVVGGRAHLGLKETIRTGDRLRLHQETSGERQAFTLKTIWQGRQQVEKAVAGSHVQLELPPGTEKGDSLFKVDVGERRQQSSKEIQPGRFVKKMAALVDPRRISQVMHNLQTPLKNPVRAKVRDERAGKERGQGRRGGGPAPQFPLEWWLRIDDLELLKLQFPATPSRLIITLCRETMAQLQRNQKRLIPYQRRLVWALPPVILEADLPFYEEAIDRLRRSGYNTWQIAHVGQRLFFAKPVSAGPNEKGHLPRGKGGRGGQAAAGQPLLFADYTVNVLNGFSAQALANLGVSGCQLAIETDRDNLFSFFGHKTAIPVGMTVYARPPLFTARLAPSFFKYETPLLSPKGEGLILKQRWGQTIAVAEQPFSLLPQTGELAGRGVAFAVLDLSNLKPRNEELVAIFKQLSGAMRGRRQSTFNYQGKLL